MKKRVISWLLCLALCLSMLPMAALAEDVQAPEGPAPSLNEPQPEPRAKENETPTPEPEKKVQSELMTAEKLLMPLSDETPAYTVGDILAERDGIEIGNKGIIGEEIRIRVIISGLDDDVQAFGTLLKSISITVDGTPYNVVGGSDGDGPMYAYCDFKPTKENHSVTFSISGTDIVKTRKLTFAKCPHPGIKSGNTCSQCGATLVAEINSATYYETLSEALDAAQTEANSGCTVTLISNSSLATGYTIKQGNFTIDLHKYEQGAGTIYVSGTADVTVKNESAGQFEGNFCWSSAAAKLTLAENSAYANLTVTAAGKTIADLLPGGYGYQFSGNWVSESELSQTTIQNVLVKKAPFTVGDFSVNSSSYYINVPFKISASVRSSSFPNGDIDFDYCLYIDNSQKKTGKQNSSSRLYMDCTLEDGSQHTAKLVVSFGGYSVTKTLVLQAVACPHTTIGQTTGKCNVCNLQMAASVSPEALVIRRTYYETFDAALSAAWKQLKTGDCWLVLFQDATISSPIANENISGERVFHIELNGKKITCANDSVFRVPESSKWTLDLRGSFQGGSLIGSNTSHGTIDVAAGGYANIDARWNYTITNTADAERAIEVHTQNSSDPSQVKIGKVDIAGDDSTNVGGIVALGGKIAINGGNFTSARATGENAELKFYSGTVSGNVTVDNHGVLRTVAESGAIFKGTTTITATGYAYFEGAPLRALF